MPHSEFSISLHLNFYFSPVYEGLGGFSLFFLTLFTEILVGGSVSRTTKPRRQQRFRTFFAPLEEGKGMWRGREGEGGVWCHTGLRSFTQSCPTLCDPVDCRPPGSSVCGLLQSRILECVTISFSRGFSQPRDEPTSPTLAGRFFTTEPLGKPFNVTSRKLQSMGWQRVRED